MIDLKKDCTPAELRAMADALEWANVRTRPQFDPKAKELRAQAERMEAAATPAEIPFPKDRRVRRNEDMSPRGYLELYLEEDGDIIVTSCGMSDGLVEPGLSVQFCAPGSGGGRSKHTHRALLGLMVAIEKDNEKSPVFRADDSEGAIGCRPADRAMLATAAGQELVRAATEALHAEREVGPPSADEIVGYICYERGELPAFTLPTSGAIPEHGWLPLCIYRPPSADAQKPVAWLYDSVIWLGGDTERTEKRVTLDSDGSERRNAQPLYLAPPDQSEKLAEMEARKDAAYYERNQVVAALAKCFPSGTARTAIEGWSEDWHGCVYIDLPTGQVSWHYHDTHAHLFAGLPAYTGEWDGHSTDAKYSRLSALLPQPDQSAKIAELTAALDEHERLARRTQAAQNERIKKLEEALKELLLELDPDDWMGDMSMIDFIRAALAKVE